MNKEQTKICLRTEHAFLKKLTNLFCNRTNLPVRIIKFILVLKIFISDDTNDYKLLTKDGN